MVPITTASSIYFLLSPADFISLVEASPSGRFDTKIATRKAMFIAPPDASVIPSAAFSGILSMMDPMNNDLLDVELPLELILESLPSFIFDLLVFDLFSRIAFAIA